jgi:nicotinate phosphoribosyltransferase
VWRFTSREGSPLADLVTLEDEEIAAGRSYTFHHPLGDYRFFTLSDYGAVRPLLSRKVREGKLDCTFPALPEVQGRVRAELNTLDDTYKRLINPHVYKVSLSDSLSALKSRLIRENLAQGAHT